MTDVTPDLMERARRWRDDGAWDDAWGLPPHHPDTDVPRDIRARLGIKIDPGMAQPRQANGHATKAPPTSSPSPSTQPDQEQPQTGRPQADHQADDDRTSGDDELPELPAPIRDGIDMWHRATLRRERPATDLLRLAAHDLFGLLKVNATVYPHLRDKSHQAVVDALQELAELGGIPDAIAQGIMEKGKRAADDPGPGADARRMDGIQQGPDGTIGEESETIEPFETFDASMWNGKEPEPRRWVTSGQIPCGEPGILNGDGGTGKTLIALQLANAVGDELPDWLGKCVLNHGPVIFYGIEEKLRELHWRFFVIRASRNLGDIRSGRVHFIADLKDPILARPDKGGVIRPTMAMHRLEKTVEKIKPALVIIENAADVFAGNENDRGQVHPFVRVMLGGLCVISDAATMLLQHPSVSGLKDDTGRSGSTGWNNAGRWRLNFTFCDGADDDIGDTRQLKTEKLNYGRKGEKFKVRWENGVFVPVVFGPTPERAAVEAVEKATAEAAVDNAFLSCLRTKIAQGITVGPNGGKNYAPSLFADMPEANGFNSKAMKKAMERLLSTGSIVVEQFGPNSHKRSRLAPSNAPSNA